MVSKSVDTMQQYNIDSSISISTIGLIMFVTCILHVPLVSVATTIITYYWFQDLFEIEA